ncbi:MAG: 5'-nucleotidase C-terminal domain-containing protein [Candidatus Melainabacteria bacterium]|nr:5'-nucleotidase C-terminal domain-containing protein [Candidatus Melainabacteria bacterium]
MSAAALVLGFCLRFYLPMVILMPFDSINFSSDKSDYIEPVKPVKPAESAQAPEKSENRPDVWADFVGSLSASVGGAVAFALGSKYHLPGLTRIASVACAGMVLRPTAKAGYEIAFLSKEKHSAGIMDCAWGAIDGLSGILGAATEAKAGAIFARNLGQKALGRPVAAAVAEEAGMRVVRNSLQTRFLYDSGRAIAGGAAGSLAFSVPHNLYNHREEIGRDPLNGLKNAGGQIAMETAAGSLFCGAASGLFTGFRSRAEIVSKFTDSLKPKSYLTSMQILHFNDLHSNLLGDNSLSRIATVVDKSRNSANGRPVHLFSLGDEYSGNVISNYTGHGRLENEAIAALKPTATIPGNHAVDMGGGKTDIRPWLNITNDLKNAEDGVSRTIAGNLEIKLPGYEGFVGPDGVVKPYRILEVANANGTKDKVGLIGLVTHELEDSNVEVHDPIEAARKYIAELQNKGVNKIVALSHLGFAEDSKLAASVDGLGAIVGAHSHDATPVPQWVLNQKTGKAVPIVQAGSEARWLGDFNLTFNHDGSANRFHTTGKLHPISASIPEHQGLKDMIERSEMFKKVSELRDSTAFSGHKLNIGFPFGKTRTEETALSNLVSDAQFEGINKVLPEEEQIELFIKHTGDIRKGLPANKQLTGHELSDVFCNGDNAKELCVAQMKGSDIKRALEFGVADLKDTTVESVDPSGNFLQGSGFKYKFDLDLPERQRVSDIQVRIPGTDKYAPIQADRIYRVGTLAHPIDKWSRKDKLVFEGVPEFMQLICGADSKATRMAAAHEYVGSKLVNLSQPRLLDQFISDPDKVKLSSLVGKRFQDITKREPLKVSNNAVAAMNIAQLANVNERAAF